MSARLLMILAAPGVGILLGLAVTYAVSRWVELGLVGFIAGVLAFNLLLDIVLLGLQRQALPPPTAHEPVGRVVSVVSVDSDGRIARVSIDGVRWQAEGETPLWSGQRVRVVGRSGLKLMVTPAEND